MFYCETCCIVNTFTTALPVCNYLTLQLCVSCGRTRYCFRMPKNPETKSINLVLVDDAKFDMGQLIGVRQFKVVRILWQLPQRVALEYTSGDMADPTTDPLIIGIISHASEAFVVRVLWDNRLWRPSDPETDAFLHMMRGVKTKTTR